MGKRGCIRKEQNVSHFYGFLAGLKDIAVEMKKCIQADLCKETITYMGFPVANESVYCRSAIRNGARVRPPTPVFFVLFLEKMLH